MEPQYIPIEQLDTIRNLVVAGWMLLALGWAAQLGYDARKDREKPKKAGPYELCKLHNRGIDECRGMHDAD